MTRRLLDLGVEDVHVPSAAHAERKNPKMAEITTRRRNELPESSFADPANRAYPIHDSAHVRNAAARLEQQKGSMSPAKYAQIKARIARAAKKFGIDSQYNKRAATTKRLHIRADIANGGSLHVSHHAMSAEGATVRMLDAVDISAELADKTDKPVWIQLAKQGTFKGHPAGPFTMDLRTFEEIVRNFRATENRRVPVDFEHATEAAPTEGSIAVVGAPAQGWIVDMKVGSDGNLWGLVEWGELARDYIKRGAYRYFSPAIRFGSKDRVTGENVGARLTSGALTNTPFLDALKPLAAKDVETQAALLVERVVGEELREMRARLAHAATEYMPSLKAALKLGDLATPAECADAVAKIRGRFDGMGGVLGVAADGVDLRGYMMGLRQVAQAQPGSTWEKVFDTIEDMIDAAIDEHEVEYHFGPPPEDDEEAEMIGDVTGAAMGDRQTNEDTMATTKDEDVTKQLKDAQETAVTLAAKVKESDAKVAELTLSLRDEKSRADKAETALTEMRDWREKREAADVAERVTEAIETYADEKKLSDADREMLTVYLKSNPKGFEERYPKVSPGKRPLLRNLTDRPDPRRPRVIGEGERGADSGETLLQTTKRLMKEKNLPYADAQNEAMRLHRAGLTG